MNKLILILIAVMLLFTIARYINLGSDITSFIVAGDRSVDQEVHPYPLKVAKNSQGYDGQKFYHLALNPFDTKADEFGIRTNLPYRKQRILYPLTAHLLAMTNHTLVPYAMVAVNLLSFFFFLLVANRFIRSLNASVNSLFLFAVLPALYIALARDLAEVMALMFLMLSLLAVHRKNIWLYAVAASCAILTREESILVVFPASIYMVLVLFQKEGGLKSKFGYYVLAIVPLIVFVTWKSFIYFNYGSYDNILVRFPFSGMISGIRENFEINFSSDRRSLVNRLFPFYCLYILLWYSVTAVYASRFIKFAEISFRSVLSYAWLIWSIFLSFLPNIVYNEELSFARVLSVYGLLSVILIVIHSKPPKLYYFFSGSMISLVMIRLILFP